jgi:hypothetical protein
MLTAAQVHNIRTASAVSNSVVNNLTPTIPSGQRASAIFATVTSFISTRNDHYMMSFGRDAVARDLVPSSLFSFAR